MNVQRKMKWMVPILLGTFLGAPAAWGAWTHSITGTVVEVRFFTADQQAGQTVVFSLSSMPTTGCANNNWFAMSTAYMTDPQIYKNFIAMLLAAKLSGQVVSVGYDAGTSCDPSGSPRIYQLMMP
jgi:hypothetical protein